LIWGVEGKDTSPPSFEVIVENEIQILRGYLSKWGIRLYTHGMDTSFPLLGRSEAKEHNRTMQKEVHSFKDVLGTRGLKSTREREIILKELESRTDHFSAEKLFSVFSRKGTRVSRATIYRTLKLLEQFHLIERLDVKGDCFYYEPVSCKRHHSHLICEHCGKIIDFSSGSIEALKLEAGKQKDFEPGNISIHVFGVCSSCQKAPRNKS
jgi:Fur family ferric uptake transcriptional regulator